MTEITVDEAEKEVPFRKLKVGDWFRNDSNDLFVKINTTTSFNVFTSKTAKYAPMVTVAKVSEVNIRVS